MCSKIWFQFQGLLKTKVSWNRFKLIWISKSTRNKCHQVDSNSCVLRFDSNFMSTRNESVTESFQTHLCSEIWFLFFESIRNKSGSSGQLLLCESVLRFVSNYHPIEILSLYFHGINQSNKTSYLLTNKIRLSNFAIITISMVHLMHRLRDQRRYCLCLLTDFGPHNIWNGADTWDNYWWNRDKKLGKCYH